MKTLEGSVVFMQQSLTHGLTSLLDRFWLLKMFSWHHSALWAFLSLRDSQVPECEN